MATGLTVGRLGYPFQFPVFLENHTKLAVIFLILLVVVGVVAALYARHQITQASQSQARVLQLAQEALETREEFLSVASHELKTPLTSLRLQVGSLRHSLRLSRDPTLKSICERLTIMDRQVDRLAQIVSDLADSFHTNEPIDVLLERLDLVSLTREVVTSHRQAFAQAGCEIALLLPPGAVYGQWDAARLKQALSNLLSNAAKYGHGRPVDVQVSCYENIARLSVRDHGIGIDPIHHGKIFERFERAVSPRHYGGFGLGLWMVRRVVNALGGSVHVASRQGDGSTFTIELPQAELIQPADPAPEREFYLAQGASFTPRQEAV